MIETESYINSYHAKGYHCIPKLLSDIELAAINALLDSYFKSKPSKEYSIRNLFQEIPDLKEKIFNNTVLSILKDLFEAQAFVTKALYFNKNSKENWYVPFHQDISIHVEEKIDTDGYSRWTLKEGIVGVVPPVKVLENTVTLRIHLDETDETNGALKIVEGSHLDGIQKSDNLKTLFDQAIVCSMGRGDAMLMKPLLFHASSKNISGKPRRVIHIEFNNLPLNGSLEWAEKTPVTN